MVVDFAKVNVKEQPLLILQNMDEYTDWCAEVCF